ncbi:hypothetical protein, partial [Vibrio anguillarum]|uniref:hypothetical protein n=1 Tax=Vibrio anguillarum TaxID=55601 RepID=UPI001BE3FEF8
PQLEDILLSKECWIQAIRDNWRLHRLFFVLLLKLLIGLRLEVLILALEAGAMDGSRKQKMKNWIGT